MTQFTKYNSLENHYQQRFIEKVLTQGQDSGTWVALEKIHGANFSLWYNPEMGVKPAKRSGFTETDFNSCWKIVDRYSGAMDSLYGRLLDLGQVSFGDTITVFGEIFGGSFFGEKVADAKRVQTGVNYSPDTEFMAFDIMLTKKDTGVTTYLPFSEVYNLLAGLISICPILTTGTFEEVFNHTNDFPSLVPENLGLDVPEGAKAICEGFVMFPLAEVKYLSNGSRIVIKSKNKTFSEVSDKPVRLPDVKLGEVDQILFEGFSAYLTENRLVNVISKEGEVTWKDFGRLSGLLMQDALVEFNKEQGFDLKESLDTSWKQASKMAAGICQGITRDYLKKNL